MKAPDLPAPIYIDTSADLAALVELLHDEPYMGMDTESNSLYAYWYHVCLIQIASSHGDYLIDPLAIDDMRPLGELTANPATQIIFHAAEFDVGALKRDFGYEFANIFDTMYSAGILGYTKVGLAYLMQAYFGVSPDKTHQKADWVQRPISEKMQHYAQLDVHYLIPLRHELASGLVTADAWEEAQEIFAETAATPPTDINIDPDGYWSLVDSADLPRYQIARLRELYLWREHLAAKLDIPPFRVLANAQLIRICKANPRTVEDLYKRHLLRPHLIETYGNALVEAVGRGRNARPPRRPRHGLSRPDTRIYYDHLRLWRKTRAEERGVNSDIILPRERLSRIARQTPRTLDDLAALEVLGPWRMAAYGREIVQVINQVASEQATHSSIQQHHIEQPTPAQEQA